MRLGVATALLLYSTFAVAAPPQGAYEAKWAIEDGQKKDLSKVLLGMLKASQPNLVWVRMMFILETGRLKVRMQSLKSVPGHPDRALGCDASVSLDVTWSGADLIIPVKVSGEGTFTTVHKTVKKTGNVTDEKSTTDSDGCNASIQKGQYRVTTSADGIMMTDSVRHQTIELVPTDPEPQYAKRF
jgi:hypothetical protein